MRRIRQKLNSQGGASILIALLFFLVAVMVAAVITSAALTAVKRVRDDQDAQQEYLTLQSAAKVLEPILEESWFAITELEGTDSQEEPYSKTEYECGGLLGKQIQKAVQYFEAFPNDASGLFTTYEATVTPALRQEETIMASATLTFRILKDQKAENQYSIDGTLKLGETSRKLFLNDIKFYFSDDDISEEIDATDDYGETIKVTRTNRKTTWGGRIQFKAFEKDDTTEEGGAQ